MSNFYAKRGKNKYNFFVHSHTLSNVKKKEQMKKAVKVFHSCVIANLVKKFMEFDFMADNPSENYDLNAVECDCEIIPTAKPDFICVRTEI